MAAKVDAGGDTSRILGRPGLTWRQRQPPGAGRPHRPVVPGSSDGMASAAHTT
jgi:hypothetical protein